MLASKIHYFASQPKCTDNRSPRPFQRSRTALRPCAIGFDLTGSTTSKSAEKCADELSRAASSLLIYRGILSSRPAQSFMDVLLHLQKGSPLKLLEHYGELYKSINNEGYSSWQDYLFDQVVRGSDNPFAKAAARGEPTAHLLPSVRHDLSVIQSLSVTEATLAGWVRETVSSISDDWITAATSLPTNSEANDNNGAVESLLDIPEDPPSHILAPLTKIQRQKLRSDLYHQSRTQVDAAVAMLQGYHAAHDYGILSTHTVLKWHQDRLQAQDVLDGIATPSLDYSDMSIALSITCALAEGLLSVDLSKRKQGCDPIIIQGCSRRAYTLAMYTVKHVNPLVKKLVYSRKRAAMAAAAAPSIRIVILPQSQLSSISELAWTMSQHPRMYFAVICPGVPTEISSDVAAIIAGRDGVSWPANAVFIGCSDTAPAETKIPGCRIKIN